LTIQKWHLLAHNDKHHRVTPFVTTVGSSQGWLVGANAKETAVNMHKAFSTPRKLLSYQYSPMQVQESTYNFRNCLRIRHPIQANPTPYLAEDAYR
jgi:hypothetical protein